jgi:hypothetical protein
VSALLRHDEHMYAFLTLELPRDSDVNIEIVRRRVLLTTRCGSVPSTFFRDDPKHFVSVDRGRQQRRPGVLNSSLNPRPWTVFEYNI